MANDLNRCEFIGRLGRDPEVSYAGNGKAVCRMSIAVGEKFKHDGEHRERTTWVPLVAFGKLGEIIAQHLKKGEQVFVAGKFMVRKWQDNSGQDRHTTEVVLHDFQMLGGGKRDSGQGEYQPTRDEIRREVGQMDHEVADATADDFDESIPF